MDRGSLARENFLKGYNCAQSVVLAFADLVPVDQALLSSLASPFGGGFGRLREVCGTVSGMSMILGLLAGYDGPETGERKAELYRREQELARRFETANGSIICRELLGLNVQREAPVPEARTAQYYEKRPCPALAESAARILEAFLQEEGIAGAAEETVCSGRAGATEAPGAAGMPGPSKED